MDYDIHLHCYEDQEELEPDPFYARSKSRLNNITLDSSFTSFGLHPGIRYSRVFWLFVMSLFICFCVGRVFLGVISEIS